MPDDWEWFWAGEGGRDNLLRSEIEGLHSQASAARSQAARLSSQLARVQGSLETRLNALAAAFDAYVELGDVREQLAGYPDTSAVRRAATAALEVLTRGGTPERLPPDRTEYWLTDAMNAVIALATGNPDPAAEARAGALDRDAELFVVAAAGAVGRGTRVADRVPPLLVTDGELTAAQHALWAAVLAGEYGDVLPAVRESWQPALDATDADWPGWVRAQAGATGPVEILGWVDRQVAAAGAGRRAEVPTSGGPAAAPGAPVPAGDLILAQPESPSSVGADPRATARTALAAVALSLLGRGLGEEVALLERARELRSRIETPAEVPGPPAQRPGAATAAPVSVVAAVRAAFLAAPPGSALRAELLRWIQPALLATVDAVVAESAASAPRSIGARTPGGVVDVSPAGVTPEQRQSAEARVRERHAPPPRSTLVAPAVVAVLLLLTTLVAGGFGRTGLAVLTGVGTVVALVVVARALAAERRRRQDLQRDLEATETVLGQTEARAQQVEAARSDALAETRRLAAGLRARLGAPLG